MHEQDDERSGTRDPESYTPFREGAHLTVLGAAVSIVPDGADAAGRAAVLHWHLDCHGVLVRWFEPFLALFVSRIYMARA